MTARQTRNLRVKLPDDTLSPAYFLGDTLVFRPIVAGTDISGALDSQGRIQISSTAGGFTQTVCHLGKSSSQNVGGANGTETWITWQTTIKKDSDYTHDSGTNPSRITITDAGRYSLIFNIGFDNTGSARCSLASQYRVDGGSAVTRGAQRNYTRGTAYGDGAVGMNTELDLTAGQYIEVGTIVDDTDATYTVNTIVANCEIILRRLS